MQKLHAPREFARAARGFCASCATGVVPTWAVTEGLLTVHGVDENVGNVFWPP